MKKVSYVYAGMVNDKGDLLHAYYEISPATFTIPPNKLAELFRQPLCDCEVGDVYEFATSADGSRVSSKTGRKLGSYQDARALAEWRSRHQAVQLTEQAWTKPLDPRFELLQPFRRAYQALPEEQRGVLLAQMVRFIVEGDST